uniref:Rad21_Rec8 domain-containing protein n=1 Tax=Caenorhabditis tropicalis TaxID=1561998 RepID=A0A1I7TK76_9PELO
MELAEKFDREQRLENDRQHVKRSKTNRSIHQSVSTPIVSLEEIDDFVDLANLPHISEQLGINGDPRDFTMTDVFPCSLTWSDNNVDLAGLYGSLEPYVGRTDHTMHSTFIEGNGSDEHEKRNAAVIHDFEDFVTPQSDTKQKHRSELIPDRNFESDNFREDPQLRNQPLDRTLRFAESLLIDPEMSQTNIGYLPRPSPPPHPEYSEMMYLDRPGPSERTDLFDKTGELPINQDQETAQEPIPSLPLELENLDLVDVPSNQQAPLAAYFQSIAELPRNETNLPPMPDNLELFDASMPPRAKRIRVQEDDGEEREDREMARRRPSSRPLTPVNQNELTELYSTLRVDAPEMEIDSQIRDVLPQRKKSKRDLPFNFGEDLDIDEAVKKVLSTNSSALVKKRKEVLVNFDSKRQKSLSLLETPQPLFFVGRRVPEEIRRMCITTSFLKIVASNVNDSENEKEKEMETDNTLKFATACLLSPPHTPPREEIPLQSGQIDFMPIHQDPLAYRELFEGSEELQVNNKHQDSTRNEGLHYAMASLLPTPEKQREIAIMEELDLDPLPISGNLKSFDFPDFDNKTIQNQEMETTIIERENVRHRQKSSLGIGNIDITEELEEHTFGIGHRQSLNKKVPQTDEDNLFYFSSGPLIPDNRDKIHEELLNEAENQYPGWLDFNEFTAGYNRKTASIAFEGLLLGLKNMKLRSEQKEPFGIILVQHIE